MGMNIVGDSNANTSASALVAGTNGLPAGLAIGDWLYIPVVYKQSVVTLGTPAGGWVSSTHRVFGAAGANVLIKGALFTLGPLSTATPTVPTLAPGGVANTPIRTAGFIAFRPDPGWIIEATDSVGSDTVSDTAFSVTGDTLLPFVAGDYVMIMHAVTANIADYQLGGSWAGLGGPPAGTSFNTLDSKWHSGGTAGTLGALRSETLAAKCNAGPASAVPVFSGTLPAASTGGAIFYRLHPVHQPWHMLGIGTAGTDNHFKLQYALDGSGAVAEQTQAQLLAGFRTDGIFYPVIEDNGDQVWCRFRVRCDGPNTGGTAYARSELRGMGSNGTSDESFNSASGQHVMRVRERWVEYGSTKPTIIGAQVHDGTDDQWQLCTQKNTTSGKVEIKSRIDGSSMGQPTPVTNYQLLDVVDSIIDINAGTTRIYVNDMVNALQITTLVAGSTLFFKAGCYLNFDETDEASTQHGAVDIYQDSLKVWHTGMAGSPPEPLQLNQPTDFLLAA